MDMKIIKLRNGAEQDITTVAIDHEILLAIHEEHPDVFQELVEHSRTGAKLSPVSYEILEGWSVLTEQGQLYEEMKNVALSMVEGTGPEMILVNPVDSTVVAPDQDSIGSILSVAYKQHLYEVDPIHEFGLTDTAAGPPLLPRRFYH